MSVPTTPAVEIDSLEKKVNDISLDFFSIKTTTKYGNERKDEDLEEYPDGGLRAWSVVLGAYVDSFGVYQDYYTRIYMPDHSAGAISWIGGVSSFLTIATGLVCGRFYDRGYCRTLILLGSLITSVSLFMLSFVKPNQFVGALFCQGIGVGLGGGITYVPSVAVVSHYFKKRREVAMIIAAAGTSLGATLNPIIMNNLLAKPKLGFANATRIYAAITTVLLIVACIVIKTRLPIPREHPQLKDCAKRFLKDDAYIALVAGFTLFAFGMLFPFFYLQLAATTHGLNERFSFYSLVTLNGSGFMARVSCGLISRRIDTYYLAIIATFICGCANPAFIGIGSPASVVAIAVFFGAFQGIYAGIMAPLVSMLTTNQAELGLRIGIAFAISGPAELIAPSILGALLTENYHWWRPALFSGITTLGATEEHEFGQQMRSAKRPRGPDQVNLEDTNTTRRPSCRY